MSTLDTTTVQPATDILVEVNDAAVIAEEVALIVEDAAEIATETIVTSEEKPIVSRYADKKNRKRGEQPIKSFEQLGAKVTEVVLDFQPDEIGDAISEFLATPVGEKAAQVLGLKESIAALDEKMKLRQRAQVQAEALNHAIQGYRTATQKIVLAHPSMTDMRAAFAESAFMKHINKLTDVLLAKREEYVKLLAEYEAVNKTLNETADIPAMKIQKGTDLAKLLTTVREL